MLSITNLIGESEGLIDYKSLIRKSAVNGERSLSFYVPKTQGNQHAFPLVDSDSSIERDGHNYNIKSIQERTIGHIPVKTVSALHSFFIELLEDHRYGVLSTGSKTINQVMSFIFTGTPWTFSVIDSFETADFEEFGNDNPLALFNQAINKFEAEFEIVRNDIRFKKQIGSLIDMQFRFNHNVKTFQKDIDANDIYTYVKGYGKLKEEKDTLGSYIPYANRSSGFYFDTGVNEDATQTVGSSFNFSFTGTGFNFKTLATFLGGIWEFKIDNEDTFNISTYNETNVQKTFEIVRDLEDKLHNVIVTFKGKDSKNPYTKTGANPVNHLLKGNIIGVYRSLVGDERYTVVAEYTSPEASKYKDRNGNVKLKHAPPLQSDTVTTHAALLKELQSKLKDKPEMTISLEFTVLKDAGYTGKPNIGDIVPTIYEPLNVDLDLRIIELEEYLETDSPPKVTLSTSKKSFVKSVMDYQKAVLDKIYDENSKKLRYNVYDEAVKRATEALNNSLTELEYPPGMGILARDPKDGSRFTVLRSAGLGITTNNGETFDNAITPDGVTTNLLTAGQIKTNNIQIIGNDNLFYWDGNYLIAIDAYDPNKFVRLNSGGLYVAKGMIDVERSDGLKTIIGGKINHDFNIQGGNPAFLVDTEIQGRYFKTFDTSGGTCDVFTFNRIARYVKFQVHMGTDIDGQQARAFVESTSNPGVWLGSASTTVALNIGGTIIGQEMTITVDLGTPSGFIDALYLKLRTNTSTSAAYLRVIRAYQTDFL